LIDDGENGLHFTAGSAEDLASKVEWAWEHPTEIARMGRSARDKFERKYGSEANYASLMEIYSNAIRENRESSGR
jgi:glycosyltransferase involved in cell wall biosynthesis